MMISTVSGHFEDFQASVKTDDDSFNNASIEFSAKIDSINTKNKDRDGHLKSDDFFNAEKYPELTFVSKSFNGEKLVGDLTIKKEYVIK
jgi:polyisoprenoid-binding protein YceI